MNELDQLIINRLREAKMRHTGLEELLDFYEQLFHAQFEFKAALTSSGKGVSQQFNTARLAEGAPQVLFDGLNIERSDFFRVYQQTADLISAHFPDQKKPDNEFPPETLVETARSIYANSNPVIISGSPVPMTDIAAGLSLMPYLQLAAEAIMPLIPQDAWQRPRCPVCGGKPSFASLARDYGARSLFCSRCNGVWQYGRIGCPFCEAGDEQLYYLSDDRRYRLYLCDACRRYLKTIDLREADAAASLPVESLVTVSMDIAAQEKGYLHC
jgi:formate dehydrogenase maturation protein FdhE